jgi:hypothetical protein
MVTDPLYKGAPMNQDAPRWLERRHCGALKGLLGDAFALFKF